MEIDWRFIGVLVIGFSLGCLLTGSLYVYSGGKLFGHPGYRCIPEINFCTINGTMDCWDYYLKADGALGLKVKNEYESIATTITAVICTESGPEHVSEVPLNRSIRLGPNEASWVVGGDSGNVVYCTDANGVPKRYSGKVYKGNLYIFYLQGNESEIKMATGRVVLNYVGIPTPT